jgi:outer membrane protein OmpA-like peptidoglycan-associated protein
MRFHSLRGSIPFAAQVAVAIAALSAGQANAQTPPAEKADFPVERFRPSYSRDGMLDVESGSVGKSFDWDVGLWANYALNPLVLYSKSSTGVDRVAPVVANRIGLNLTGAISLFEWVQLGVDLPVVAFQNRTVGDIGTRLGTNELSSAAIGDLRISPKIRLLRSDDQFVDLAIMPSVTLPTSTLGKAAYQGERQFTFVPEVLVSKQFDSGLHLGANLGYRYRPEAREILNLTVDDELLYRFGIGYRFGSMPLEIDGTLSGATWVGQPTEDLAEIPMEGLVGVKYDILPFLQANVGFGGGILPGFGTPDIRALVGLRLFSPSDLDKDDDGINDSDDACVDQAEDKDGFEDTDGCPDIDNDQDGVLDVNDGAPNDPEDKDGYNDEDGVPDPDNDSDGVLDADDKCPIEAGVASNNGCPLQDADKDGILDKDDKCVNQAGIAALQGCPAPPDKDKDGVADADDKCIDIPGPKAQGGCPDTDGDGFADNVDKCPKEPEVVNNVEDDDGCPDKGKSLVKLTADKIEILDKVFFDTSKSTIKSVSFPLLDQVATVLKSHPEVKKVRVAGHTDDQGKDDANLKLSEDRATAVREYLIKKGVPAERLESKGFGETAPVADNKTKQGREQNRRVEFNIVEQEGSAVKESK